MTIRPATADDIDRFYGPVPVPVQLFVLDDGEAIGIGGLCWLDDGIFAVSWFTEAAKVRRRIVLRVARFARALIEKTGEPVYARNDPDEPGADIFLRHIGFERISPADEPEGLYAYRHHLSGREALRPDE